MVQDIKQNNKKEAIGLIHKIYLIQEKNKKLYTASTKTKGEVRGGGKKPWKQKGTGNARAGSSRSSIWVGGGVSFGPKPRIVTKKANVKERKLAVLSAFYLKQNDFKFIENNFFEKFTELKTKIITTKLKEIGLLENSKICIIVKNLSKNLKLASQNIKNICIVEANNITINHLLNNDYIILSNEIYNLINNLYAKK